MFEVKFNTKKEAEDHAKKLIGSLKNPLAWTFRSDKDVKYTNTYLNKKSLIEINESKDENGVVHFYAYHFNGVVDPVKAETIEKAIEKMKAKIEEKVKYYQSFSDIIE